MSSSLRWPDYQSALTLRPIICTIPGTTIDPQADRVCRDDLNSIATDALVPRPGAVVLVPVSGVAFAKLNAGDISQSISYGVSKGGCIHLIRVVIRL